MKGRSSLSCGHQNLVKPLPPWALGADGAGSSRKDLDNIMDNRSLHNWRLQGAARIYPLTSLTQQSWLLGSMRETVQRAARLAEGLCVACSIAAICCCRSLGR